MHRKAFCLSTMVVTFMVCAAQEPQEDILLTDNGIILRGTITDKHTPGGTITIIQPGGKASAAFWSELVAVRTLPAGIPDSVIWGSFDSREKTDQQGHRVRVYEAPRKTPKFDFRGYEDDEDILFLADGSILRGVLINQRGDGVYSMWTSGLWKEVAGSSILTSVRDRKGIPDTTLRHTYRQVPEEWREGELRIFSIHGGVAIPMGGLSTPRQDGRSSVQLGPAVTVEAGIRLWPGIRWLTNATYSRHPLGLPTFYLDARTSGNATVLNVVRLMIGGEVRTFSASNCRTRFTALVGLISMNADGYVATFPATSRHLSGTATIDGISSASSGFTLGAGLLLWRFSLDITWTSFRPEYTSRVNVLYYSGSTSEIVNSAEESGGFVSIVFGVSIL